MDPEIHELLIGAQTEALGAFDNAWEGSIYDGMIDVRTNPQGYVKDFASADGTGFEKFQGEFNVGELSYRGYQILAQKYGKVLQIPKLERQQLLAWLGNQFPGMLSNALADSASKMDELITSLIKSAIDPTATNKNLFNDTKFFGKFDLPSSGALAPAKLDNVVVAKTRDVAGVRAAHYKAKAKISKMVKPNGTTYHSGGVFREGFELMFATEDEQIVNEVYNNGSTTSTDNKDKINGVDTVENNLWDNEEMDLMILSPKRRRGMGMFQVIKTTDVPQFESDLSSLTPGYASAEQIRLQKYTFGATLEFEAGFGSPYRGVAILLPKK